MIQSCQEALQELDNATAQYRNLLPSTFSMVTFTHTYTFRMKLTVVFCFIFVFLLARVRSHLRKRTSP